MGLKVLTTGRDQDVGVVGHEVHLLPQIHLYVKWFSQNIYWTLGRRPQTAKKAKGKKKSPCNWIGKKRKQARQELGWDVYHGAGAMEEERPLPPGKPPHCPGDQPGQKGSSTASEERAAACLWQPEHRKSCTDGQCCHQTLPSLTCESTAAGRAGRWNSGFRYQKWGEDWDWLCGTDWRAGIQCDYTWGCMTTRLRQVDIGRGERAWKPG